jgi:putative ABC transport system permease protein
MKTIIRNFLSVLRRYKLATALNVLGLSVAFAAFMVIMMQVSFEYNFDRSHPTSDRVYRVNVTKEGIWAYIHPRVFTEEVIRSSPHIEAGALVLPFVSDIYFTALNEAGEQQGFKQDLYTCHAEITRVFDFSVLYGDRDCLNDPEKVAIPLSLARTLFGDEPAVGKMLHTKRPVWSKDLADFTIGAVYRDFPDNTQLRNVIYTAIAPDYDTGNWGSSNYLCYILLDSPASAQTVTDNFNAHFDFTKIQNGDGDRLQLELIPLTDVYYRNEAPDERIVRSGSRESSMLLLGIALLVIVIAAINFTNFSIAMVPVRIKSINTQKVLGCSDGALRISLLSEAVCTALLAFAVALGLVHTLRQAGALSFLTADLHLEAHIPLLLLTAGAALAIGLVAGLYPAWYATSFPPALALKGSFGLSTKGRRLRTALIGFQFFVSIALIIVSMFVQLQRSFMQNYPVGFDRDQIAIVQLDHSMYVDHRDSYVDRLKQYAGIGDVAFAAERMGAQDTYSTSTFRNNGNPIQFFWMNVSWNFLQVMGIPVIEGNAPLPSSGQDGTQVFLFNRQARDAFQLSPGVQNLSGGTRTTNIIGFTENVKFNSLRNADPNMAFVVGNDGFDFSYIRLKAGTDMFAAVDHIRQTVAGFDPTYPVTVEFYDQVFEQLYHKEEALNRSISLLGVLAIIISIVGVFGLVLFETQYRKKEIGIRKVFGSTTGEILTLFNKIYFRIVCICFVLAAPVAWYAVTRWLENFAYKTPLYWWVFVAAFAIVTVITLATVTFQNWRAANVNPVESLKMN